MARHDLLTWADDTLKPAAEPAYAGDGEAAYGNWCGFCKAKTTCRARAKANLELAKHEFRVPPLLEDTDIEEILGKLDQLVAWASDIKDYALKQALSGKRWVGFKLVEGRSNRRYVDEEAVAEAVEAAGFEPFERRLLGITSMQRMFGKRRFGELLGSLMEKPQDRPTLVPQGDKRPPMGDAKKDFNDKEEGNDND